MNIGEITSNQRWAFLLGIATAFIYWFHLLLLTQKKIRVDNEQLIGLAFAVAISILSWFRFVLVTNKSFKD
jgi:arginine exporter protein ArgO